MKKIIKNNKIFHLKIFLTVKKNKKKKIKNN